MTIIVTLALYHTLYLQSVTLTFFGFPDNTTGLFVAPFYHFYVHDKEGFIGNILRKNIPLAKFLGLDDKTFALCFVSGFMQVMGILQMPQFLGPSFTPFGPALLSPFFDSSTWTVGKYEGAYAEKKKEQSQLAAKKNRSIATPHDDEGGEQIGTASKSKKRRNRNKKKTS